LHQSGFAMANCCEKVKYLITISIIDFRAHLSSKIGQNCQTIQRRHGKQWTGIWKLGNRRRKRFHGALGEPL
jgi:hypothetical protein